MGGGPLTGFLGGNVDVPTRQESSETANASSQMINFQAFEGEHLMAKVGSNIGPSTSWFHTFGTSFKLL